MIIWLRHLDIFLSSSSTQKESTNKKPEGPNDYGKESSIELDVFKIIRRKKNTIRTVNEQEISTNDVTFCRSGFPKSISSLQTTFKSLNFCISMECFPFKNN